MTHTTDRPTPTPTPAGTTPARVVVQPPTAAGSARADPAPGGGHHRASALALLVPLASVAFTVVWLVLGARNTGYDLWDIEVTSYSPIAQPISGLGLGNTALAMNATFLAYGLLLLAAGLAVGRLLAPLDPSAGRWSTWTFGLVGVGSVLVGVFTLESMALHSLGFLLFLASIATLVPIGRKLTRLPGQKRRGRALARLAPATTAVLTVAYFASFDPVAAGENIGYAGLTERILILCIQAWLSLLALTARRAALEVASVEDAI